MNDFSSLAQVKYKSKFNFELKKNISQTKYKSKFTFEFKKKFDFYVSML